jgi:hypothetical protein
VAAITAASALAMQEAGLDWGFYYHIQDQAADPEAFRPFFTAQGVSHMVRHWNEVPHRFGLFGVDGEARPQYFAFDLLGRVTGVRLAAATDTPDLRLLAGRDGDALSTLIVNHGESGAHDRVVEISYQNIVPGRKRIVVYRIDDDRHWNDATLELEPVERRETFTEGAFSHQVWAPAHAVLLVQIEGLG